MWLGTGEWVPVEDPDVGPMLRQGDRVRVFDGYDMQPAWLASDDNGYIGSVVAFVPGQNKEPAAVVELDDPLVLPLGAGDAQGPIAGRVLVLELGHKGSSWATVAPRVHVELCEERPEPRPWQERTRGHWVESHATLERLEPPEQ
jgi:hypothetical protein